MFAVEVHAAVRHFVFVEDNSRREAARVFGLSRETVLKRPWRAVWLDPSRATRCISFTAKLKLPPK